ncbi:Transcription initiation factor TFIID subunit 9 [Xylographa opegraphella]|nr:Transcription initiation factor TFIID subunit 9 [Xylographa opegraphella]
MVEPNGRTADSPIGPTQSTQTPPPPTHPSNPAIDAPLAPSSLQDDGLGKRPRDARLIHMVLANAGVTAYQERVPLQLMDFAYRYTSSTLQDALHLTHESYGTAVPPGAGRGGAAVDANAVSLLGLRLSVASRTHYQFSPVLPKEFYQEVAAERNRVALPGVGKEWGRRLPPERYCLTGVGWGMKEEWDSEEEGEEEGRREEAVKGDGEADFDMGDGAEEVVGDEEGDARMEDFFGEAEADGEEDRDMGEA